MPSSASCLLLLGGLLQAAAVGAKPIVARDGTSPAGPYDPNTTQYCSWWVEFAAGNTCSTLVEDNFLSLADFRRWNPTVTVDCAGLVVGNSYCVEAYNEQLPAPGPTTQAPTSSPTSTTVTSKSSTPAVIVTSSAAPSTTSKANPVPSTTTSAGNGVATPQPIQAGMVSNCNKFHYIAKDVTCGQVISYQKITLEDFVKWNPSVLSDCSGMWAEVNVCVGVIGGTTATSTKAPTTTTSAGNGVSTPQPTQPGMVTNCNKFHYIETGVVCSQVTSYQKISLEDFVKWNPTVGSDCRGMQAKVNVCVGVIGGSTTTTKAPTTTTSAGNGVSTPQPTQPGMVTNCNKFHYIETGVVCSQVTSYQKISLEDFVKWNPTVGSDCRGMQAKVNVCVGVIGGSPTTIKPTTTTTAGNGVQTPQPTQPGMVTNCKKFHYAETGVTCSQIISYNHISLADFVKWNSGVGSDCRLMWGKTYTCVGV